MRKIKFSKCPVGKHKGESWAKLQYPQVGELFTTARGYEWKKHNYYASSVNEVFEVIEEGKFIGTASLVSVEPRVQVIRGEIWNDTFHDMTLDEWDELLRMFYKRRNVALLWLTFRWETVPSERRG